MLLNGLGAASWRLGLEHDGCFQSALHFVRVGCAGVFIYIACAVCFQAFMMLKCVRDGWKTKMSKYFYGSFPLKANTCAFITIVVFALEAGHFLTNGSMPINATSIILFAVYRACRVIFVVLPFTETL